jgi:hypothetical protein|tara:strand:+ start:448 stop:606 length:159 start_codon:yes stop_codon:yes gene_type:complete
MEALLINLDNTTTLSEQVVSSPKSIVESQLEVKVIINVLPVSYLPKKPDSSH